MTLVVAIESCDGAGKSTAADRVAHMVRGHAWHHDAVRNRDALDKARAYREQRRALRGWRGAVIVADRWWLSSLVLSHVAQSTADTLASSVEFDGEHDRIVRYASAIRREVLDEIDEEASEGVRVVTVYRARRSTRCGRARHQRGAVAIGGGRYRRRSRRMSRSRRRGASTPSTQSNRLRASRLTWR